MKGLLYAGTETGVYFSPDDGAHWQSLQLNLPTSPVHDLAVKDDDLVAATHGRAFWILDDVSPLRQANSAIAADDFHLYQPATAIRLHFPDEVDRKRPVGDNPPKGAILDYYLKAKPATKKRSRSRSSTRKASACAGSPITRKARRSNRPSGPTARSRRICCPTKRV